MNPLLVTSEKPNSTNINNHSFFCSIDTLSLDLKTINLTKNEFFESLKENGLRITEGYYKNHKARLEIRLEDNKKFYAQTSGYGEEIVHTLITNPSQYICLAYYFRDLIRVLGDKFLELTVLKRLDLTIDIKKNLEDVLNNLEVLYKSSSDHASYKGKSYNFVMFGKSASGELIKIYDKSKSFKTSHKITRVEIQLTKKKLRDLFGNSFEDLFPKLNDPTFHRSKSNPWKKVRLVDFQLRKQKKNDLVGLKKYYMLKGAICACPKPIAIKRLNTAGNFQRDYKSIITSKTADTNLWFIYMQGIREWVNFSGDIEQKEIER